MDIVTQLKDVAMHGNPCHSPSGQLYCCDSFDTGSCSGGKRCDSYFTYCLRPFGESQLTTSRCSSAQILTSSTNQNDLTFLGAKCLVWTIH